MNGDIDENQSRLTARLHNSEDNLIERKPEGANSSELRETLVAFANSVEEGQTAVLFLGVSDSGVPIGVANTDKLQQTITRIATQDCYPPIIVKSFVIREANGKSLREYLAIEVPPSTKRPHFAGPAYVRRGSQNISASEERYSELITTNCGKAGEILKWKGKLITVHTFGSRLGNPLGFFSDPRGDITECRVVACTPFNVELLIIACVDQHISEPLTNVTLDRDIQKQRLRFIIRRPK